MCQVYQVKRPHGSYLAQTLRLGALRPVLRHPLDTAARAQ